MQAHRLLFATLSGSLFALGAAAETIVVRSDPCPAPDNAPKLIMFLDVPADDLNDNAVDADNVAVYFITPTEGWASARILARFDLEGAPARRRGRSCR
jgi:hypothetical protein